MECGSHGLCCSFLPACPPGCSVPPQPSALQAPRCLACCSKHGVMPPEAFSPSDKRCGAHCRQHPSHNRMVRPSGRFHEVFTMRASLVAQTVKSLPAMQETQVQSWGGKDPLEREWLPTPVFLLGEFHGQRSLAGNGPWDFKQTDTTERLSFLLHFNEVKIL